MALLTEGWYIDGVRLDAPRVGDLLAVPATGAYCFTMANNYNAQPRPAVVLVGATQRSVAEPVAAASAPSA
mgnify:CR=1 FL=1